MISVTNKSLGNRVNGCSLADRNGPSKAYDFVIAEPRPRHDPHGQSCRTIHNRAVYGVGMGISGF